MKNLPLSICSCVLSALFLAPQVMARTNSLITGLTFSYDYYDRQLSEDDGGQGAGIIRDDSDDDYNRLALTPLLQYISTGERDRLELRAAPNLRYDLDETDTEWDNNLFVAGERSLSQDWQIRAYNRYSKTDNSRGTDDFSEPDTVVEQAEAAEPQVSSDLGRTRYWRNTLDLASEYRYRQDSLMYLGFNWIVFRNDDDFRLSDEYDRYDMTLRDEHRFNVRWRSIAELSAVRGDFKETGPESLSDDLWEYHIALGVENNSIDRNPLFLTYSYTTTVYDESLQNDEDLHEMRLTWRRDFSPYFYTNIGAGPSYLKTEGFDGEWGYNGIVEANYRVERGSYRMAVEKDYSADNFSGNEERGISDAWDAEFSFARQLSVDLSIDGRLGYRHEDRTSGFVEYSEERYRAGLGLRYSFNRYYSTRLSYSFITLDSDRDVDDYDDHRLLLSFSWEQELFRW